MRRIPFQKPYTNAHDLVCLLQSRDLTIADTAKAESYLEYIGYYRLSAYMYPLLQMPKEQHRYKPNTEKKYHNIIKRVYCTEIQSDAE